ncbi:MAG TPA: hypothetical protein VM076_03350, partial [Gemmatimonadaceae bacterium]|nr:hypothetical protein [Gemmatimonadaceae bacterium]
AASRGTTATAVWPRGRGLVALGVVTTVALASIVWTASRTPAASAEITRVPYPNLIDESVFSGVTITPSGRALVYTGSAETGKPIMLLPLDARAAHAIPGTEGGIYAFVSPDGRRVVFQSTGNSFKTVPIDAPAASGSLIEGVQRRIFGKPEGWYYGSGAWGDQASIVTEHGGPARGLARRSLAGDTLASLTRADTTHGENSHRAPLVLPGGRSVVFTVSMYGGPTGISGPLAIASLGPPGSVSRHVRLGVDARRAIAFVDGWLLYVSTDGRAIMAVRLDVGRQRTTGSPVQVLEEPAGDLETGALADNGTLLYVRHPSTNSLVLVDSTGAVRTLPAKTAGWMMNPRISPDSRRVAVQTTMSGVGHDVWLYDVATGTPTRLTTTGKALQPTWDPDGHHIVFMKPKYDGLMSQPVDGGAATAVRGSTGGFAPMVAPDGKSIVFQRPARSTGWKVWSVPTSGDSMARPLVDDSLSHAMPAVSPDGRWVAEVSNGTGRNEVYVRSLPGPGAAVKVSDGGGAEPAWSPDGRRIYYRVRGAFMAANVATSPLSITSPRQLFKDAFDGAMPHRNYDVLPDGSGFVMISGGTPETVVVLNWLTELRARLDRVR